MLHDLGRVSVQDGKQKSEMTRILITGGCGFVGTNLVSSLCTANVSDVRVFDNLSLGQREHLAEFEVEFVEGDVRDEARLRKAMEGCDSVVHLAADTRVVDSIANPVLNFESNVVGSFNLLKLARELEVSRIVVASTGGAILGEAPPPTNEEMPAHPTSPYGASKLAVEGYCSAFAVSYGMKVLSLRFSNVYGRRSYHKGSVIAHFYKQLLAGRELVVYGDGTQQRDYIFVDDLCRGILLALSTPDVTGTVQLATGKPTTVKEVLLLMQEVVGNEFQVSARYEPFRAGEIRNTYCDIRKARELLGFEAHTELREGLRLTWKWFLGHTGSR